jgi:hypothetical protein
VAVLGGLLSEFGAGDPGLTHQASGRLWACLAIDSSPLVADTGLAHRLAVSGAARSRQRECGRAFG